MNTRILREIKERSPDMVLLVLLISCLLLALGGIRSGIEKRESLSAAGGGRRVDVTKVRKQISEGALSPRKALFYKKLAE